MKIRVLVTLIFLTEMVFSTIPQYIYVNGKTQSGTKDSVLFCEKVSKIDSIDFHKFPSSVSCTELIQDSKFENGFSLTPLTVPEYKKIGYVDSLYFTSNAGAPVWGLAQWQSRNNLAGAVRQTDSDGSDFYANSGKRIARYPDNSILLELKASAEYDYARLSGETWPALLIEQKFSSKPNVSSAKQIILSFELMLVNSENKMVSGTYISGLHTAHSPFYLNIKDPISNSFIWFGIQSYDYRFPQLSDVDKSSWDIGTSTYIYQNAPRKIWGDISFNDKQWHKAEVNVLPLILNAYNAVRLLGHFETTNFEDLVINALNFGWESPGTFDASIRIKNISLKIYK